MNNVMNKNMTNQTDMLSMDKAIARAVQSVNRGGGPFGATLVGRSLKSGRLLSFTDNNHVTEFNDPTAHAEVSVIREACKFMGTFSLEGFTLYSSCEPCPMCLSAALWARVDRVLFAADRFDAAAAGFDDLAFYEALNIDSSGLTFVEQMKVPHFNAPFEAWAAKADRVEY